MHLLILAFCVLDELTSLFFFFFFNDTATTEIYTLSLHDALPISLSVPGSLYPGLSLGFLLKDYLRSVILMRSEEHTSELQSRSDLVCRLLLEKKKQLPAVCIRDQLLPSLQQPAPRRYSLLCQPPA